MERYLPLERHSSERFMFMPADVSYVDAAAAFTPGQEREKRLAAIFLTQNGGADEPLIGMITPWDVLGRAKRSIVRPEFGDTGAAVRRADVDGARSGHVSPPGRRCPTHISRFICQRTHYWDLDNQVYSGIVISHRLKRL